MKRTGIVSRRKSGNLVYYAFQNKKILDICDSLCEDIENRYRRRTPETRRTKSRPTIKNRVSEKPEDVHPEKKTDLEIHQPGLKGL
jgi:hypothetical protein